MRIRCVLVAFLVACSPAIALAQAVPSQTNPNTPSPPAPGSIGMDRGTGTGATAKPGSQARIAQADGVFVREAAAANKAEIALGTLAQTRGGSADVKAFAEKMVADHTKAYDELARAASKNAVNVPTEPTAAQKRAAAKLEKLSGSAFDQQFIRVMIADHKTAVDLFRNEATNGRDPDLKAWAAKTLPTLEDHLKMAQQLQTTARSGSRSH